MSRAEQSHKWKRICFTAVLVCFCNLTVVAQPSARIEVDAGDYSRFNTAVTIALQRLPGQMQNATLRLVELTESGVQPIAFQKASKSDQLIWIMQGHTPAGKRRIYELSQGVPEAPSQVGLIIDEAGIEISDEKRSVLRYQYAEAEPPVDNPLYRRSAFIHPIWAPNGAVLTRINPSDHIHHMGFWHPWTKTEYKGRKIDFWNLKEGQGTIRFSGFDAVDTGPVAASFTARHSYVDLTVPDKEEIALDETWTVTVWSGSAADSVFIWDLIISQSCATTAPFTILKYRYSGFGFRGTADWNETNSNYLTSEGKTREDGNGTRARWCDVYGQTDAGMAGILFLSHPGNHEHPEPMRIWPQGDVFFGFCPVESEDWQMQPDQKYVRHYRAVVHNGKLSPDSAEQFWLDYANPPAVKILLNP